jgi:formate hydrogenlyase transcriptional activator
VTQQIEVAVDNARHAEALRQSELLQHLAAGTASATGAEFFRSLVKHLASALSVRYAFITQCTDATMTRVRTLAFWEGRDFGENFEYALAGTPCENVIGGHICYYPKDLQTLFPQDLGLVEWGTESFLGIPIRDSWKNVLGHLAALDVRPMSDKPRGMTILQIFAARAGAELERKQAEEALQKALVEVEQLKNRLQIENVYLQEEIRTEHNFEEIIGRSESLKKVLHGVEQVARTDAIVLIQGETGTGKELIARAIHSLSPRKDRPLVKVNCGVISTGLVESELFGHEKGAFTGALQRRIGRFELADGGTIFLDEVGELPLDTQVKLLRVLQEGEFERVGSSKSIKVDVRVIAATNRNLEESVRAGRFRSDLFYRLNVLPLRVPPLRERKSDIPLLVSFFLARFAKRLGKQIHGVSKDTMDRLVSYNWPGNIRELQNVIERAVVLALGPVIQIDESILGLNVGSETLGREALEDVERAHILRVLGQTNWVIDGKRGAASILGINPNTLRSRMQKLGVLRSRK